MIRHSKRFSLFVFGALVLSLPAATAAQPYIYPNLGQTPQQQEFDKG